MTNYHHGQIAYEGFGEAMGWKFPDGTTIPQWHELPADADALRDAWGAAALAVITAVLG